MRHKLEKKGTKEKAREEQRTDQTSQQTQSFDTGNINFRLKHQVQSKKSPITTRQKSVNNKQLIGTPIFLQKSGNDLINPNEKENEERDSIQ